VIFTVSISYPLAQFALLITANIRGVARHFFGGGGIKVLNSRFDVTSRSGAAGTSRFVFTIGTCHARESVCDHYAVRRPTLLLLLCYTVHVDVGRTTGAVSSFRVVCTTLCLGKDRPRAP